MDEVHAAANRADSRAIARPAPRRGAAHAWPVRTDPPARRHPTRARHRGSYACLISCTSFWSDCFASPNSIAVFGR